MHDVLYTDVFSGIHVSVKPRALKAILVSAALHTWRKEKASGAFWKDQLISIFLLTKSRQLSQL